MNNTLVTFTGNLATEPERRQTASGKTVTNVRVATTERRLDRQSGKYVDGATTFYTVTSWNWIADRVADCLQKGDPVFVAGRLVEKSYKNRDGENMTYLEVEADAIGPDLRGTSVEVIRRRRADQPSSLPESISESTASSDPWTSPLGQQAEPAA